MAQIHALFRNNRKALVAIVSMSICFSSTFASAQSDTLYGEIIVEGSVDRNIECAATIMALGSGTELASMVAVFFIQDATSTLVNLGGWDDPEAASMSVLLRASLRSEEITIVGVSGMKKADLEQQQQECVMIRFAE